MAQAGFNTFIFTATVSSLVPDSTLMRFEEVARAVTVAASFLDVSGAAVSQLVQGLGQSAGDPEHVRSVDYTAC